MNIPWWVWALLVLGLNFVLWSLVGLCRVAEGHVVRLVRFIRRADQPRMVESNGNVLVMRDRDNRGNTGGRTGPLTVNDVAVLIAAHNEELVIWESLAAIVRLVPVTNIHVVSDGSTDRTAEIAAEAGVQVMRTRTNLGKAGALEEAIREFELTDRFPVVMLLDADTRVESGYFRAALPLFDDPRVVAVAGCVRTATDRRLSTVGKLLVAHRMRIYAIGQRLLKVGQTWLRTNATHIVPGFASMYRTAVLPRIEMNPAGLVIEDFNMTFELYQKRLGKVGFSLSAVAVTQDPGNFRDYLRQTQRWALGLWQTVWRHPPRANLFTAMVTLLLLELVTSSVMFLLFPVLLLILLAPLVWDGVLSWAPFGAVHTEVSVYVNLQAMFFGVVVPDFAMTCAVALIERRLRLLLYGLFFLPLRVVDAAIALYALPRSLFVSSSGRWRSPARRTVNSEQAMDTSAGEVEAAS